MDDQRLSLILHSPMNQSLHKYLLQHLPLFCLVYIPSLPETTNVINSRHFVNNCPTKWRMHACVIRPGAPIIESQLLCGDCSHGCKSWQPSHELPRGREKSRHTSHLRLSPRCSATLGDFSDFGKLFLRK